MAGMDIADPPVDFMSLARAYGVPSERVEKGSEITSAVMILQAMDGDSLADQDHLMRVLGQVWFAVLTFWVRGWSQGIQMADDLDAAAHLMIHD